MCDFIDARTDLERAVHWQNVAADMAASARANFDDGWRLLVSSQQEDARMWYELARKLMQLE